MRATSGNLPNIVNRISSHFLAGSLPGEALVHLRQLSLLGMITRLQGSTLHRHALNSFDSNPSSASWFHRVRDLCLQYQLPHPLSLLSAATPIPKEVYNSLVKKHVINYWEMKLRDEASPLTSLRLFHPQFMSLARPHPIFLSARSSPYEVVSPGNLPIRKIQERQTLHVLVQKPPWLLSLALMC